SVGSSRARDVRRGIGGGHDDARDNGTAGIDDRAGQRGPNRLAVESCRAGEEREEESSYEELQASTWRLEKLSITAPLAFTDMQTARHSQLPTASLPSPFSRWRIALRSEALAGHGPRCA